VVVVIALLALTGIGVWRSARDWPLWRALRRVRPATPERLAKAARDGHLDGRIVAVAGLAAAGANGPLASTVNDAPCVWHRHTVHKRHISYQGQAQRYSRPRQVADIASVEPFLLRGARAPVGAGAAALPDPAVEVRPAGMRMHGPVAGGVRILPGLAGKPFPPVEALVGRLAHLYWHREWVLPAGASLLVLGELTFADAGPVLRRPGRGPHVVSTRTHVSLTRRLAVCAVGWLAIATVAALAGAALLCLHYG
jgi:hypothetical protein